MTLSPKEADGGRGVLPDVDSDRKRETEMWIWLCLIAGIILGVIILLPEPSDDVEALVSLLDELDEEGLLEDEVLLYYDEEDEGLLDDESE